MAGSARRPLIAVGLVAFTAAVVVGAQSWGKGSDRDGGAAPGAETAPVTAAPTSMPTPAPGGTTMPTRAEDVATDEPAATAGGDVAVVVSQAGWAASGQGVEIVGFVTGVVEDGGTCRATLTRDGQTFTAERKGLADATTTACGSLEVGDAEMDAGEWQAVLSYTSRGSAAESEPVRVLVPTR